MLASCDVSPHGTRNASLVPTPISPLIRRVFTEDLLGERISYLEHLVGPPIHVRGGEREYVVDSCRLFVANRSTVGWFRVDLSDKCTFDPKPFLWNYPLPQLNRMRLGDFNDDSADISVECLVSCGNQQIPRISKSHQGSHADNYIEVRLDAEDSGENLKLTAPMLEAVEDKRGQGWLFQHRCSEEILDYNVVAKLKVTSITIGHDIPGIPSFCDDDQLPVSSPVEAVATAPRYFTKSSFEQYVLNKTKSELRAEFGPPDSVDEAHDRWYYLPFNKTLYVTDPDAGVRVGPLIAFFGVKGPSDAVVDVRF